MMRRTRRSAPSTALTLAFIAVGICFAPLRADAENFTLELEAAVREIIQRAEEQVRSEPRSFMFKDMHAVVVGVGDQLLRRNEQMKNENMPVNERIPALRQLYLTEMRKLHKLKPDGSSSVKYNERNQTLMCYHYEITASGSSFGGGGGTFASRLNHLLQFHMMERDPFARDLNAALSSLQDDWRRIRHSNFNLLQTHRGGRSSAGSPMTRPLLPGLTPIPVPLSRLEFPRGVVSIVDNIDYELSKLDVEMSLKGESDEKRSKKLGIKLIEVVQKFEKFDMLAPLVQFDEEAGKLLFYDDAGNPQLDSAGAHLTFTFPSALMSMLDIKEARKAAKKAADSRMTLFMGGAAALILLLFGGIYLAMRFSSAKDENTESE